MNIKLIVSGLFVISLTGCYEEQEKDGSGTIRYEIFKQCMSTAKEFDNKLESLFLEDSSYDGIADIVETCTSTSYYISNDIQKRG